MRVAGDSVQRSTSAGRSLQRISRTDVTVFVARKCANTRWRVFRAPHFWKPQVCSAHLKDQFEPVQPVGWSVTTSGPRPLQCESWTKSTPMRRRHCGAHRKGLSELHKRLLGLRLVVLPLDASATSTDLCSARSPPLTPTLRCRRTGLVFFRKAPFHRLSAVRGGAGFSLRNSAPPLRALTETCVTRATLRRAGGSDHESNIDNISYLMNYHF